MAFYKKQFSEKFGVHYPVAVTVGKPVDTDQVAARLAEISTVSRADVLAVLGNLPGVLADYMAQGKSVHLDGLGHFRYTVSAKGVADEADFDFSSQVKAVRVQFTPERAGGNTRGAKPTRPLVPGKIEWVEYGGAASEADGSGADGGEPGGGEAPDPIV